MKLVQRYFDENMIVLDEMHNTLQIIVDTACAIASIKNKKKTLYLIFVL